MKKTSLFLLLFYCFTSIAQIHVQSDLRLENRLKKHIKYLASNKLAGRGTGTKGGDLAADYLKKQYQKSGLTVQDQPFEVTQSVSVKFSQLEIDQILMQQNIDYYTVSPSGNGQISGKTIFVNYGIIAPEFNHHDFLDSNAVAGKIAIIRLGAPGGCSPHGKWGQYTDIPLKVENAKKFGAIGVLLIKDSCEDLSSIFESKNIPSQFPVLYVTQTGFQKIWNNDLTKSKSVSMQVALQRNTVTTRNVIAYVDNKAPFTIVLGAHYDHLGHGEMGGSLYRGPKAVHHGADDNASGTAALLELARIIHKNPRFEKYNFVFASFSGEELGLLGSKKYVENPLFTSLNQISYMINMDMIGRLHENQLTLSGFGTSPLWAHWIDTTFGGLKCKLEYSGIGPSDHTSFYLRDIPVIAFFTNAHPDYHKPSDLADKINYAGEVTIIQDILNTIDRSSGKATFSRTKETNNQSGVRFSVSLGIIPDYAYEGPGVKVDGLSDGKPAQKAGLKVGDIITQLGNTPISDIQVYMKALATYKKGDSCSILIQRGKESIPVQIQF